MISYILSLFLLLTAVLSAPTEPYRYYLKAIFPSSNTATSTPLYISSSITYNGHTNYVLLTPSTLAQPLSLFTGDGSITIDTSNVIGGSSEGPLLLSDADGFNGVYKQVLLGDEMSGTYTTGFKVDEASGGLDLSKEDFGGFVACTAARGVKQVYWVRQGDLEANENVPVVCEGVRFERVWSLNGTTSG
ncbi:uncharacterized protein BDV14DRAFT_207085 [Aspergillus stella-maris]|uniref:uncharacterized protein n=1 Tax=Aspergillus stella-maris TaxID=1810926 RepID=UPI003CCDF5E4